MSPRNRLFCFAVIATFLLGSCSSRMVKRSDLLQRIVEHRESVDFVDRERVSVRLALLDKTKLSVVAWRFGDLFISSDGEFLPVATGEGDVGIASSADCVDVPVSELSEFRERFDYLDVPEQSRRLMENFMDDPISSESAGGDAWRSLVAVEHNRLFRDLSNPLWDWSDIMYRADMLMDLAQQCEAYDVMESLEKLRLAGRVVESLRGMARSGQASKVEHLLLAEMNASDGKTYRANDTRLPGFMSGGWLVKQLRRREMSDLGRYWDSTLLTRYVNKKGSGLWSSWTLGDRMKNWVATALRRDGTWQDFIEWTQR